MKKLKLAKAVAAVALTGAALVALAGCGGGSAQSLQIGVPSDPTNEARALLLLQDQGLLTLKDGAGLQATKNDIADNPHNIEIVEMEAASLPTSLPDLDMAVINGNYAIGAGLDMSSTLALEATDSEAAEQYQNVVACRNGEQDSPKIKALVAALSTQKVKDYIDATYSGAVVSVCDIVDESAIPQAEGDDTTIKVGASPAPHAEILAQVVDMLAEKGWTLEVTEFNDYIQPNVAVTDGELDANYFQHIAYLNDYNEQNGTDLANAGGIHFEPLGLYPGKTTSLDGLQ
ncbi:MAG: MetQ/NlpA family ABC transporter substrate-binding protein [Eggerthellaceae bacterium]|nr:MetQ/NlpA family ABC transporter substrate-binding protein [Eggerthellaceae bacterium]